MFYTGPDSPDRVAPRDLESAQRIISSLHRDLLDLRKTNYQLEQRCVTAEHSNSQLHQRIIALEGANVNLSHRESRLRTSVEDYAKLMDKNRELAEAAHESVDQVTKLSAELKRASKIIEKKNDEVDQLREANENLERELDREKQEYLILREKYESSVRRKKYVSSQMKGVMDANRELKKLLQERHAQYEEKASEKIEDLERQLSDVESSFEVYRKRYSKMKALAKKFKETSAKLEASERERKSLIQTVQSFKEAMETSESKGAEMAESLREQNKELMENLQKTQSALAEKTEEVDNLKSAGADREMKMKASGAELKRRLKESVAKVEDLEMSVAEYEGNEKQYSEYLKKTSAQIEEKLIEIEKLKTDLWKLRNVEKENAALTTALQSATSQLKQMENANLLLESENAKLLRQHEDQTREMQEEIQRLESGKEDTNQKLEAQRQEMIKLRDEHSKGEEKLATMTMEKNELMIKLEGMKCAPVFDSDVAEQLSQEKRTNAELTARLEESMKQNEKLQREISLRIQTASESLNANSQENEELKRQIASLNEELQQKNRELAMVSVDLSTMKVALHKSETELANLKQKQTNGVESET